ncbi:MAG: hypothetical protein LC732_06245 [Acidobacteria bacterium]|nr:hypothetical protein [Acidobacteriota bacterium]
MSANHYRGNLGCVTAEVGTGLAGTDAAEGAFILLNILFQQRQLDTYTDVYTPAAQAAIQSPTSTPTAAM